MLSPNTHHLARAFVAICSHLLQAGGAAPHFPSRAAENNGLGQVHLTPLKSAATGLGAGFTRAASRTLTFPLDTVKTRSQLSRLGAEDKAHLPEARRGASLAQMTTEDAPKTPPPYLPKSFFFLLDFLMAGRVANVLNMLPLKKISRSQPLEKFSCCLGAFPVVSLPHTKSRR